MSIGKIEYNIDQPWTVTQNNIIGPTKDVNFRPESALINPASNVITKDNVDTIYLDPINGSNSNTGFTLELAVRTFDEAVSKITSSGRTYIHIDVLPLSLKSTFPTTTFDVTSPTPAGITKSSDNSLWVTTSHPPVVATDIQNIEVDGTFKSVIPTIGIVDPLSAVIGVTIDSSGHLWITETLGPKKIYKITDTGILKLSFASSLFAPATIIMNGISFDPSDSSLWVVGGIVDTIFNIDQEGNLIDSFPVSAYGGGAPSGISVTTDGNLFISEPVTGNIYKVTKKGILIQSFLNTALTNPFDIVDGGDGTIWATDIVPPRTINNLRINPQTDLEVEANLGGLAVDISGTAIKAQVTPGMTAKVTFDGAYFWKVTGGQTNEFHGLFLRALNPKTSFRIVITPIPLIAFDIYPPFGVDDNITGGITWQFDWCDLEMLAFACQGTPTANVSIFRQLAGETVFTNKVFFLTVAAGIFDRNIFISNDTTKTWLIMASSSAPVTLTNNTFQTGFAIFQSSGANSGVVTIHSNIVNGFTKFNNVTGTAGGRFFPIIEFSLLNLSTTDPNIDTTSGNNIFDILPLFRQQGIDFRLMKKGIESETGFLFVFNSPAIETGAGGKDMGAYDITYAKGLETYDTLIMQTDDCQSDAYDIVKYQPIRINYREFNMVKGEYKNDFDALCAEISFNFPKDYFSGTNWTQRFKKMFQSKGLKRYFPEGELGIGLGVGINSGANPYELTITDNDGRESDEDEWFKGWAIRVRQPVLLFADTASQTLYTTEIDGSVFKLDVYTLFAVVALNVTGLSQSPLRQNRTLYIVDDANGNGSIYHVTYPGMVLIKKTDIDTINSNWTSPAGIFADYNGIWLSVVDNTFNQRIIVRLDLELNELFTIRDFSLDTLTKDPKGKLWLIDTANKEADFIDFEGRTIDSTTKLTGIVPVDISVSSGDIMWIVEPSTNTIHRLQKDGTPISTFLTTGFSAGATDTTAMCIIENKVTTVLINSNTDGVFKTSYLAGDVLTFPLKDDTEFYISHLPSQLKMPKFDANSEYYIDGNRTPWSKDSSKIDPSEFHLRKWVIKQGKEKSFE